MDQVKEFTAFTSFALVACVTARTAAQSPAATQPSGGPKPVAQSPEPFHDFGSVIEGQKLKHTFKIVNSGTTALQIDRIASSCGCMTVGSHPNSLAPGQTGEFPITVDTANLLGIFMKTANVYTNDPATPMLALTLRGEGKRLVEVVPVSAGFGRIADERTHQQVLTITNRSDKPMTVSIGNAYKAGKFAFDLVETVPGIEYKLFVVLRPPFQEGTIKGSVVLNTNVELQKTLEVSAAAIVLSKIEVMPNILYVGEAQPGSPTAGKPSIKALEFSNRGDKPLYLVDATADDPGVRVTSKEVEAGRLYRLLVAFPADYRPPPEGRTITLVTNDAATPEVKVPIRLAGPIVRRTPPSGATTLPATTPPNGALPAGTAPTVTTRPTTTAATEAPKKPVMELVGKPAPEFSLTAMSGMQVGGTEFKNYPATVLNFVAPNCPFCKKQVPTIEKVRADYEARGVRFVNMSETLHEKVFTPAESQAAFDQLGSRLELAMDPGNVVGRRFRITSFPVLVVVGKDGLIADAYPGARADLPETLKQRLEMLLAAESGAAPRKTTAKP